MGGAEDAVVALCDAILVLNTLIVGIANVPLVLVTSRMAMNDSSS